MLFETKSVKSIFLWVKKSPPFVIPRKFYPQLIGQKPKAKSPITSSGVARKMALAVAHFCPPSLPLSSGATVRTKGKIIYHLKGKMCLVFVCEEFEWQDR